MKINLGINKRVKINGERVTVPHKRMNEVTVTNVNDTVMVQTRIGVSIVWDGRGFLEVSVPSRYKGEEKKNRRISYYKLLKRSILFIVSGDVKYSLKYYVGITYTFYIAGGFFH